MNARLVKERVNTLFNWLSENNFPAIETFIETYLNTKDSCVPKSNRYIWKKIFIHAVLYFYKEEHVTIGTPSNSLGLSIDHQESLILIERLINKKILNKKDVSIEDLVT